MKNVQTQTDLNCFCVYSSCNAKKLGNLCQICKQDTHTAHVKYKTSQKSKETNLILQKGLHWIRAVSSSRSIVSPWRVCWEKGDLSPNNLNPKKQQWIWDQALHWSPNDGNRSAKRIQTERRATREERSVPCRRRGGTAPERWLWDSSTSRASSESLPFASPPFRSRKPLMPLRSLLYHSLSLSLSVAGKETNFWSRRRRESLKSDKKWVGVPELASVRTETGGEEFFQRFWNKNQKKTALLFWKFDFKMGHF